MKLLSAGLLTTLCVLTSCSIQRGGNDEALIMPQKRAEWERARHADPATGTIPANIRVRELAYAQTMPGSLALLERNGEREQSDAWTSRGPWNIGGRTRAFAIDASDERVLLAGGVSAGMWRSEDAGGTWTRTTRPDQLHSVASIAQDTRTGKTQTWYYSTGEIWGNSAQISGNGVFKSIDGGTSWNVLPSTVESKIYVQGPFGFTWRIATNPTSSTDDVYLATARAGIYRSSNGGTTWKQVLASSSLFADVVVTRSGVLYAALSSSTGIRGEVAPGAGIYRSLDGVAWIKISPPDMPASINRITLGIAPSDPEQVWAIAETPGSGTKGVFVLSYETREEWHSLWKYSHGTWTNKSANIPLFGGRNGDFFSQGGYDLLVRIHPSDTNYVIVGGTSLYRSTNGYASTTNTTWIGGYGSTSTPTERYSQYPNHHPDQHELAFLPSNPTIVYSCNDGGLWRTNNGRADSVKWDDLNRGYLATQFYTVNVVQKADDERIIGGLQDNGTFSTSVLNGTSAWNRRSGGDGSFVQYVQGGKELYVSSQQGVVRRVLLSDAGVETTRTRIDPIGAKNYLFINPFMADPNNDRVLYVAGGSILWRNSDVSTIPLGSMDSTAVNWDSLPATRLASGQISAVAVLRVPANSVLYGTTNGSLYRLDNAHVVGSVPTLISKSPFPKGANVSSIAVDSTNSQHIVVALSNYNVVSIVSTLDGGASWEIIAGNLEENTSGSGNGPAVNSVAIMRYAEGTNVYVAATSTGVYTTTQLNGSSTVWTQSAAAVIGNVPVEMVVARNADRTIHAASHGAGMFSGTMPSLPAPGAGPELVAPVNGKRAVFTDRVLRWTSVPTAVSYAVELATDATFTQNVKVIDGVREDSVKVTGLTQGPVEYWWRVYAFGEGGRSLPSTTWSFRTAVRPPTLLVPVTNAKDVVGNPVHIEWERVSGATSYDLLVANSLTFETIVHERNGLVDTAYGIPLLESNKRYHWKVRSVDADTAGLFSTRSSFVTGVLTSVNDASAVPAWCTLSSTVVSTTSVLRVHTDRSVQCTVALVDVQGRTLKMFVNASLDSGDHALALSFTDVAQGAYVLVVQRGSEKCTHHVEVLR